MAYERLRWGSFVILSLTLACWVIALGGVSALTWMSCTDTQATRTDIATTEGPAAPIVYGIFGVPAVGTDVAVCSRSMKWEWWVLFFEFAALTYGLLSTLLPNRLPRARFAVAQYLAIAVVLVMIAINIDINWVWFFWDQKKLFSEWSGATQKFYMSSAAAVAGWICVAILNFIYIGFALDFHVEEAKPATSAV